MVASVKQLIIEWVNPAGSGQNQLATASLKTDVLRGGVPALMVPPDKVWVVVDMVKGGGTTVGGRVEILVNDEPIGVTRDVVQYDPANPSRPDELVGTYFMGGSTLKANVYVNPNTGSTDIVETLELTIEEYTVEEFLEEYG